MTNELAAKEENSRKLIHYTPVINSEQGFQEQAHRQETPPFYVSHSQPTHVLQKPVDNSDFISAKIMEKKSELQDLLEELVNTDINEETNTTEKPWWLQEESLLGEVKLDYEDSKIETKPRPAGFLLAATMVS